MKPVILICLLLSCVMVSAQTPTPLPDCESMTCQLWPHMCPWCDDPTWTPPPSTPTPTPPLPTPTVTPTPPPGPTEDPLVDYVLPRGVGVTQVLHEGYFTTGQLFDELSEHDINIVQVWIAGNPFDAEGAWGWVTEWGVEMCCMGSDDPLVEDMGYVWTHPAIDVIIVRFTSMAWANSITGEARHVISNPFWINEPTFEIANKLLELYGNEDKDIIFASWEADNQWWMQEGRVPTEDHTGWINYVRTRTNQRQAAVERARALHPDAALRIYFALELNLFEERDDHWGLNITKDMVSQLEYDPDFLVISHWSQEQSIIERLNYIMFHTGYPAHRVFILQVGAREYDVPGMPEFCDPIAKPPDERILPGEPFENPRWHSYDWYIRCWPMIDRNGGTLQYQRLMEVIPPAFEAGMQIAVVWIWRQIGHEFRNDGRPKNFGMWVWGDEEGEFTGQENSGLRAIRELNERWRNE